MTVMTTAGTVLSLTATLPATQAPSDWNAIGTFVAAGEVTDLGDLGKEYNTVSHSPIGSRRVIKIKGSYNNGTQTIQMGRDFTDPGQIQFQNALSSDNDYAFRIVL